MGEKMIEDELRPEYNLSELVRVPPKEIEVLIEHDCIPLSHIRQDRVKNKYYCHWIDTELDENGKFLADFYFCVQVSDEDINNLKNNKISLRNILMKENKYLLVVMNEKEIFKSFILNDLDSFYIRVLNNDFSKELAIGRTKEINNNLIIDYDTDNNIVGIEILSYSDCLPKEGVFLNREEP